MLAYIVWVKKKGKLTLETSRQWVLQVIHELIQSQNDSRNSSRHLTIQLPACASHMIFYGLSTREPIVIKSRTSLFFTSIHQALTLNLYIKYHKYIGKWLTKYNQIWHGIKANKTWLSWCDCLRSMSASEIGFLRYATHINVFNALVSFGLP